MTSQIVYQQYKARSCHLNYSSRFSASHAILHSFGKCCRIMESKCKIWL